MRVVRRGSASLMLPLIDLMKVSVELWEAESLEDRHADETPWSWPGPLSRPVPSMGLELLPRWRCRRRLRS